MASLGLGQSSRQATSLSAVEVSSDHHAPAKGLDEMEISTPSDNQEPNMKPARRSARSVYAGLGWLDRLLVLWILLAIIIGMVLGNFVPNIGPALQRGKFVDVSVPIGENVWMHITVEVLTWSSYWASCHDVPDSLQDSL